MSAAGSGRSEHAARAGAARSSLSNTPALCPSGSAGSGPALSATLSSASSSSSGASLGRAESPPGAGPPPGGEPVANRGQAAQVIAGGELAGGQSEEQQQEENRKLRLQLYVFVLRCISYSFNAKPTNANELHYKQQQLKLRKEQLEQIICLHNRYLNCSSSFGPARSPHQHLKSLSSEQLRQLDELYERAHSSFNRKYLANDRMRLFVDYECCSQQDLRELFRRNVEKTLNQSRLFNEANQAVRQAQLAASGAGGPAGAPMMAQSQVDKSDNIGNSKVANYASLLASKDMLINSWLIKFESIIRGGELGEQLGATDSEALALAPAPATPAPAGAQVGVSGPPQQQQAQQQLGVSKEQLYQMFQNILNIKKFEHQLLYNALQLDSADEQAAAIRRELDGRIARIAELERNRKLMPKFVLKEMDSLYLDESRMSVNKLMVNLDSLPVMKGSGSESRGVGYGLQKFRRYNNR